MIKWLGQCFVLLGLISVLSVTGCLSRHSILTPTQFSQVLPAFNYKAYYLTYTDNQQHEMHASLVIKQDVTHNNSEWLIFNPLGMPLARKQLTDKGWANKGFIAPNTQMDHWLEVMLFSLTDEKSLSQNYPQAIHSLKTRYLGSEYIITYQPNIITIDWNNGNKLHMKEAL